MQKISWQAPEYIHREKTPDWYWIVGIVTVSIALISIILSNLIFAVLIIVSSFALSLFAGRKPNPVLVEIDNRGVSVGKTAHPYATLDSFWIETRDNHPRLILKSKKTLSPLISVLLDDVNPGDVDALLSEHLPEEEHAEPILEKLLIYLGF